MMMALLLRIKEKISPSLLLSFHHQAHHFLAADKIHNNCCGLVSVPSSHHYHLLTTIAWFSASTIQDSPLTAETPFIVDYLIKSCGISQDKALKASKYVAHVTTPKKPDSVIQFLKSNGWDDALINKFIVADPRVLAADVKNTLKPKMKALQMLGFSDSELIQLISDDPCAFYASNLRSKFKFWRTILETNERMLKAFKRNRFLLTCSLEKRIMPNIAFLRECGFSDPQIAAVVLTTPRVIGYKLDELKEIASRANEFIPYGSGMYPQLLRSLCCISRSTFDSKCDLFRSLGWSEDEIISVIRKCPVILRMSAEKICDTIDFLVKKAGYEMPYIVRLPVILTYSLEKRLIPRHYVLNTLKSKQLPLGRSDLYTTVSLTGEKFLNRFVIPYEAAVPGLREAYDAACAGKVSI